MKPKLLFLNQSSGTLFIELAHVVAEHFGEAILVTGSKVKSYSPALTIVKAAEYDKRTLITRGFSWLKYALSAILISLKMPSDCVIFVVSNPPILPFIAYILRKLRGQPYVLLVYDIYPHILVKLGRLAENNWLVRLWHMLNVKALNKAERVITIGSYMAQTLASSMSSKVAQARLKVVPTWVDTECFRPIPKAKNTFVKEYAQQDHITVMYSGNIGFTHDLTGLIHAAERLQDRPLIHFLIIGEGPSKPDLLKYVQSRGMTNVTFLPFQSEGMLPYSLAAADIAVVPIRTGIQGLMMPSKTYYMMAVGASLLTLSQAPNDLSEILVKHHCGLNADPADVDAIVTALLRLATDDAFRSTCACNARMAAVTHFSRHVNAAKMIKTLQPVMANVESQ